MKNKKKYKKSFQFTKNKQIIVQSLRRNSHKKYTYYKNQKI